MKKVTMARIYFTEGDQELLSLLEFLRQEAKVCGVTVYRGVAGFGESGEIHRSHLLDISFDLPIVVEFFDSPSRVTDVVDKLKEVIPAGHIACWDAKVSK